MILVIQIALGVLLAGIIFLAGLWWVGSNV